MDNIFCEIVGDRDDGWQDGALMFVAKLMPKEVKDDAGEGGWRIHVAGQTIFRACFMDEETCCGIPVLASFWERPEASKYHKTIGQELKKHLDAKCVYMSAYVPQQKSWRGTMKILQAAGFKPGLSLRSKHGRYNNVRMEWFSTKTKEGKKRAAALAPIAV